MAIIRCPYCHAIIDENDKYCNNCGTQLLFPEDEAVEEEIPGEKIIDVEEEEEEKDYELHEPGKETTELLEEDRKEETGEGGSQELVELLEEEESVGKEEAKEPGGDEEKTREVVVVEETPTTRAAADKATLEAPEKPPCRKPGPEEETRVCAAAPAGEKEGESGGEKARPGEPEQAEERPPVPATFDTRELEGIGRTVDLGKERLDKMIDDMGERQKEQAPEEAPKPAPKKATGTLPPWADRIRGTGAGVEREDTRAIGLRFDTGTPGGREVADQTHESEPGGMKEGLAETEEEEIFPRRKRPDSGIGLPEGVAQPALPFAPPEEEEIETGEEEAFEHAVAPPLVAPPKREETRPLLRQEAAAEAGLEKQQEAEEKVARPPFQISIFLKAKAFDCLFIGVIWLVALWVAARSMRATLIDLLSVTPGSVLLLYATFILIYFFLFKFFLGETLGDRLFRERE